MVTLRLLAVLVLEIRTGDLPRLSTLEWRVLAQPFLVLIRLLVWLKKSLAELGLELLQALSHGRINNQTPVVVRNRRRCLDHPARRSLRQILLPGLLHDHVVSPVPPVQTVFGGLGVRVTENLQGLVHQNLVINLRCLVCLIRQRLRAIDCIKLVVYRPEQFFSRWIGHWLKLHRGWHVSV